MFPMPVSGTPSILEVSDIAASGSEVDVANIMKPTVEVASPVTSEIPTAPFKTKRLPLSRITSAINRINELINNSQYGTVH